MGRAPRPGQVDPCHWSGHRKWPCPPGWMASRAWVVLPAPTPVGMGANLSKDCVVLGIAKYMELWDSQTYKDYLAESESDFRDAAEEFNDINF